MNTVGTVTCKYCSSDSVVKFGTFEGIQRYWCKRCRRKFTATGALPKMKTPANVIAAALGMYFGGMPLDSIQRQLQQQYGIYMSESGIYYWILRFTKEAVERTKDFRPEVGSTWVADETMLNVGGRKVWFWDIIDMKSRYLLASHLSTTRTTTDAMILMQKAALRAGKVPRRVITDKLAAYLDGIEMAFGADAKHIQSKPFTVDNSTNIIERFHGTLKDRTKVVRHFRNMETAKLLTDGWLVYYNFFKEHSALGNVPPAQKAGKVPFKDWAGVLEQTNRDMIGPTPKPTAVIRTPAITVQSHSRPMARQKTTRPIARRQVQRSVSGMRL